MHPAKWGKPECLHSDIEIVKVRLLVVPSVFFPHTASRRTILSKYVILMLYMLGPKVVLNQALNNCTPKNARQDK